MPRTLPASQQTALAGNSHVLANIVSIEWSGATEYYMLRGGTSQVDPDGAITFKHTLVEVPNIQRAVNLDIYTNQPLQSINFDILIDQSDTSGRIDERAEEENPIGLVCRVYCVMNAAGETLSTSDWILLGKYIINGFRDTGETVLFNGIDVFQAYGGNRIGRPITRELRPDAKYAFGKMIPYIYGSVSDCPCYLVDSGARDFLDASLGESDTVVRLQGDVDVFPATGTIYIGNEQITYTAVDSANDTLGTTASPVTRGANGTSVSSHGFGTPVTEKLNAYRFVVADHACNSISNVRVNGSTISAEDYTTLAPAFDGRTLQLISISELPLLNVPSGSTTRKRLLEEATPITWSEVASSFVVENFENAVSTDEEAHVTFARLPDSSTTAVWWGQQSNDLSANTTDIKRAWLMIEYQARFSSDSITWPVLADAPNWAIAASGVQVQAGYISEPPDVADGSLATNSLDLFSFSSGNTRTKINTRLQLIASPYQDNSDDDAVLDYWPNHEGVGAGQEPVVISEDGRNICSVLVRGGDGIRLEDATGLSQRTTTALRARQTQDDLPDECRIKKITATWDLYLDALTSDALEYITARVFFGLTGFTGAPGSRYIVRTNSTEVPYRYTISVSGDWSKSDISALDMRLHSFASWDSIPDTVRASSLWTALDFTVKELTLSFEIEHSRMGEDTSLSGSALVPSSRVEQRIEITDIVNAAGGWDFFDGSRQVAVALPAASSGLTLDLYNVDFEVEVGESYQQQVTEETAYCLADVTGIVGASGTHITPEETITKLITDSDYYGLTANDYNETQLASACATAAARAVGTWTMDRRIADRESYASLLFSAITESGIRCAFDGGELVFFDSYVSDFDDIDDAITRDIMVTFPTRTRTELSLIANDIGVYFERQADGDNGFQSVSEVEDLNSKDSAWGTLRRTVDMEWIRNSNIADSIAEWLITDYASPRLLVQVDLPLGPTIDYLLGDIVSLTDSYSRFAGESGRIVGLSFPQPGIQRVTVAITDARVRVWEDVASGSYIDAYRGWRRLVIVNAGTTVGEIRSGGWYVAGSITEWPLTGTTTQADTVDYAGGLISFAVKDGATFERVMTIDGSGNVRVDKVINTNAYPIASTQTWEDYIETDDTTGADTLITLDLNRVAVKFDETDRSITLRRFVENATL